MNDDKKESSLKKENSIKIQVEIPVSSGSGGGVNVKKKKIVIESDDQTSVRFRNYIFVRKVTISISLPFSPPPPRYFVVFRYVTTLPPPVLN